MKLWQIYQQPSSMLSEHPRTQATMIEKFIDCEIEFIELNKNLFQVKVNLDGKI